MMNGYILTPFLKRNTNKHCIAIVPYTYKDFNSDRVVDWQNITYHLVGDKKKRQGRMMPSSADLMTIARRLDMSYARTRREQPALRAVEAYLTQAQTQETEAA